MNINNIVVESNVSQGVSISEKSTKYYKVSYCRVAENQKNCLILIQRPILCLKNDTRVSVRVPYTSAAYNI